MQQHLAYESPNVEGSRYCLQSLVAVIRIDKASPIFKLSHRKVVTQLSKSKNTVVTKSTLYRRIRDYENDEMLPTSGDVGVYRGRQS